MVYLPFRRWRQENMMSLVLNNESSAREGFGTVRIPSLVKYKGKLSSGISFGKNLKLNPYRLKRLLFFLTIEKFFAAASIKKRAGGKLIDFAEQTYYQTFWLQFFSDPKNAFPT